MSDNIRAAHIARGCAVCCKNHKVYFRGEDSETLTRDELLVAYRHACDALESAREAARQDHEMAQVFEETKKFFKSFGL